MNTCSLCAKPAKLRCVCGTRYDTTSCQKLMWKTHKYICKEINDECFPQPPLEAEESALFYKLICETEGTEWTAERAKRAMEAQEHIAEDLTLQQIALSRRLQRVTIHQTQPNFYITSKPHLAIFLDLAQLQMRSDAYCIPHEIAKKFQELYFSLESLIYTRISTKLENFISPPLITLFTVEVLDVIPILFKRIHSFNTEQEINRLDNYKLFQIEMRLLARAIEYDQDKAELQYGGWNKIGADKLTTTYHQDIAKATKSFTQELLVRNKGSTFGAF